MKVFNVIAAIKWSKLEFRCMVAVNVILTCVFPALIQNPVRIKTAQKALTHNSSLLA
jgi:hypothetical protein